MPTFLSHRRTYTSPVRYFMLRTVGALQDFMRKAHWWPLCRDVRSIWSRFSMAGLATVSLLPASSPAAAQSVQPRMHNDAGASLQLASRGFEIKCQQRFDISSDMPGHGDETLFACKQRKHMTQVFFFIKNSPSWVCSFLKIILLCLYLSASHHNSSGRDVLFHYRRDSVLCI